MRYYTHIALGVLLYTLFVWIFNQTFSVAGILFTAWISIMPDLIERAIGEHRSWGHSIIWLIPIISSFFFNITLGIAFISGFLSHILLDIITKKGVSFFYPFNKTRFVMPGKEKSRIQTGSKQEKALFLVIILILAPIAYGVVYGMPNYGELTGGNNSTLSKITGNNSTLGDLIKKITGNLKGNSSSGYSGYKSNSNYTPYQKTSATDKTTAQITPNTTKDDSSALIDWLTNNPQSDDIQTNNNTNTSQNSSQNDIVSLLDPLFDDLSGSNNTEQNITMESDSADYVPSDYDPTNNPDQDNYDDSGSDDSSGDDGNWFDFFLTVAPIFKVK